MAVNIRALAESLLLSTALVSGVAQSARAQQAADTFELPPVVVAGEAEGATPAANGGRATASSASPVIDYVATDSRVGTKTDTPLALTPQSITVVGDQQMRDQGVQNIQEAVRYVPGVFADGFGLDGRGDYSIIRGIPASYFVDGLRNGFGYYQNTIAIEPYALERVEVLRGPSSMLYGQSSIGGLINGVSKLPLATPRNEVMVEYGSFDFKQIKFDTTGPLTTDGTWLYRVVGLARAADTQTDFVDNNRLMLAPSITYRPNADTSITLLANIRDDKTGSVQQFLPQIGTLTPNKFGQRATFSTYVGEPNDYYDTQSQALTLFFDHAFDNNIKLLSTTRYSHIENQYKSTYAAVLTPARLAALNGILGFDYFNPAYAPFLNAGQSDIGRAVTYQNTETSVFNTDNYLTGTIQTGAFSHKLTGGVDFTQFAVSVESSGTLLDNIFPGQPAFNMYFPVYNQSTYLLDLGGQTYSPWNIPLTARPREVQNQLGFYLQDQIKAGPWMMILGGRQDLLSIEQEGATTEDLTAFSWRAALMYETGFGFNPYVSYSTSFEPQPGQPVGRNIYSTAYGETLRPAQPLEGEQVEAGFKYRHPTLPLAINGAIYQLQQNNVIVQPDILFDSVQGADIKVRGLELEVIGKILPELKVVASYSYTDATYAEYPELYPGASGIAQYMKGKPVDGIPQNLASLWAIYSPVDGAMRGWSVGGGVRYVGESQSYGRDIATQEDFFVETPSYTLFDAMVSYETPKWRVQITAQNLLNTFYVASCTAYRGDCGIGQARTVIGALTYKF